eukprot:66408-Hanusia_phi.AAC.2
MASDRTVNRTVPKFGKDFNPGHLPTCSPLSRDSCGSPDRLSTVRRWHVAPQPLRGSANAVTAKYYYLTTADPV